MFQSSSDKCTASPACIFLRPILNSSRSIAAASGRNRSEMRQLKEKGGARPGCAGMEKESMRLDGWRGSERALALMRDGRKEGRTDGAKEGRRERGKRR